MITVAVVDRSAESRTKIVQSLTRAFSDPKNDLTFIPRLNIVPYAREELRFNATPDLIVVGPEIIEAEITDISTIRRGAPQSRLLALVPGSRNRIGMIEHLSRLGVDDLVEDGATAKELLTRVLLLARKVERKHSGTLVVVDGAKGGVGATSVVAGLADTLATSGKRVTVLDADVVNWGLSRFLGVRPLINENLQQLLDGSRGHADDVIAQCQILTALGEHEIACVTPPMALESWWERGSGWARAMVTTLEWLDARTDVLLVDVSTARGAMAEVFYRAADRAVVVLSNDPASLPSALERVRMINGGVAPELPITLVINQTQRDGITFATLRRELLRVTDRAGVQLHASPIPFSSEGGRWPGSGLSLATIGGRQLTQSFKLLASALELLPALPAESTLERLKARFASLTRPHSGDNATRGLETKAKPPAILVGPPPQQQQLQLTAATPEPIEFFVSAPVVVAAPQQKLESIEEPLISEARIVGA